MQQGTSDSKLSGVGRLGRLLEDQRGANAIEWTLLLGAIAIPSYYIILVALDTLVAHYQLVTTLNALPFP